MNAELRARIVQEARTWLGTPFSPHASTKGVGCDCVTFALAVYKAAGAAPLDAELPRYRIDRGAHNPDSQLLAWLQACPWLRREESPGLGSVVAMRVGASEHHVALLVGEHAIVHVWQSRGCVEYDTRTPLFRRTVHSYWGPR